jgi:hypothetical protein
MGMKEDLILMDRKDELTGLMNFAKNTKVVTEELYNIVKMAKLEREIQDANWRFGDMSIMCDEIVEVCERELGV